MLQSKSTSDRSIDWSSHEGAEALAEQLRAFWRQRYGEYPRFWLERTGGTVHAPVWAIRSDLIDGLPRIKEAA